jgi:protein SCO1/2
MGLVGLVAVAGVPACNGEPAAEESSPDGPWGADYFPNIELTTHEGEKVRFFDDLIEGRVVVINFIYTSCPDSCPLETARLAELQQILGDRVGDDVFMYSISIDPEVDTPEVLAEYRARFDAGPGWVFLTGNEDEIAELRRKLGLYIPEIQTDDNNNHNLSLIIGNQATGRWMKRSPFENPHVLATQVGSWLHDWKLPSEEVRDFKDAPRLRQISDGERLFRTRCAACHTIGGDVVGGASTADRTKSGPDLLGVTDRRDPEWLQRWIAEPDVMLAEGDPIATALFEQYNQVAMPNMRLSEIDVRDLTTFLKSKNRRARGETERVRGVVTVEDDVDGFEVEDAWVVQPPKGARVVGGYLTLKNTSDRDDALVEVRSPTFESIELHEMRMDEGLMGMFELETMPVAAGGLLSLTPGGKHLMMNSPRRRLSAGHSVRMTLVFSSGREVTMTVPVRD